MSDPEKIRIPMDRCTVDSGGSEVAGSSTGVTMRILEPQPDSALRATITTTDTTGECGTEGRVAQQHPTATRVGVVPSQVAVADPKSVPPPPPDLALNPAPDWIFDGVYRIDFQDSKAVVENDTLAKNTADSSERWAFRSACSDSGCVATGALLDDSN